MRKLGGSSIVGLVCALCFVFTGCGSSSSDRSRPTAGGAAGSGNTAGSGARAETNTGGSATGTGGNTGGNGTGTGGNTGGSGTGTGGNTGGSGTGGSTPTGAPIPLQDYPTAVAQALCPALTTCCVGIGVPLTASQCETTLAARSGAYEDADPANYTYDSVAAGACVATSQQAIVASGCSVDELDESIWCDSVFTGLLQPGEPCSADVECAAAPGDDISCEENTTGEGDVCVVERPAAAGEDCYWTCTDEPSGFQTCSGAGSGRPVVQGQCFTNDGLYCNSENICQAQGGIGAACSGSNSCAEGFCNTSTGLCTTPAMAGGSCTTDPGCAEGLYCDAQVCTPELAPGSPCEITDECRNGDCENGVCVEDGPVDPTLFGMAFVCLALSGGFPTP